MSAAREVSHSKLLPPLSSKSRLTEYTRFPRLASRSGAVGPAGCCPVLRDRVVLLLGLVLGRGALGEHLREVALGHLGASGRAEECCPHCGCSGKWATVALLPTHLSACFRAWPVKMSENATDSIKIPKNHDSLPKNLEVAFLAEKKELACRGLSEVLSAPRWTRTPPSPGTQNPKS